MRPDSSLVIGAVGASYLEVLGTAGDYYVAEGTLGASEPTPVALPGSPDDDVEPRGQGAKVTGKSAKKLFPAKRPRQI